MASQGCETKQTNNENEQNCEWLSIDEESWEQTIVFTQNLGWHQEYGVKDEGYPKQTVTPSTNELNSQ